MKTILKNKKAYHDYQIEDRLEAGLVLQGSEVKTLRLGHGSIVDAFVVIRDGEAWLHGMHLPPLKQAAYFNHQELRPKKVLMSREQLQKWDKATSVKGFTIVPLEVYFNDDGLAKVEIGLAKGKAEHDKRDTEKKRDAQREMDRAKRRDR